MVLNQSKLLIKDNSGVKKIKCVSTLNKNSVKAFQQFKGVILKSNSQSLIKGQLVGGMLTHHSKKLGAHSGKFKSFNSNYSIILKEGNKNKVGLLSSRLTGIQISNLKKFLDKKISSTLEICK